VNSGIPHHPICILGAGPGGCATALFLAAKGIPSLLLDKAIFPRDKVCGDALSGKVVEVLNKLDPQMVPSIAGNEQYLGSWGVTFVAPNTKALRVPFKKEIEKSRPAPGFVSKRIDFDQFMVNECKKKPLINLQEGMGVNRWERRKEGWTLFDSKDNAITTCNLLIAADGAQSRFAKEVGGHHIQPKHYCAGLRAYYEGITGLDADNFIELHFLKEFLPGYFWIFPLPGGMANVGVGMRSDKVSSKKVNLREKMFEIIREYPTLKERFANAKRIGDVKGFGLPLGSVKRPISGDHYLLVGDAASLIDPFTGEGIGNAVFSGMFAAVQAEKCLAAGDFSAAFNKEYDQETYNRLWSELKLSRRMQQMVNHPWIFNLVVNKAQKNRTLRETISCMFDDLDMRARLRSPKFYFQLLFSNGNK
jgi:menaquinone-9 beta-reductase